MKLFCEFLIRPEYRWAAECKWRFGTHPVQICFEWNTLAHLTDCQGATECRPMTRQELQRVFDYAAAQAEVRRQRKGALSAYRDAMLFKVIYARASPHHARSAVIVPDPVPRFLIDPLRRLPAAQHDPLANWAERLCTY